MEAYKIIKIAKYRVHIYRILLHIFLRKKGSELNKISYMDYLPLFYGNRTVKSHEGFKAVPRLKTDDFICLFFEREKEIKEHLKINPNETFVDVGSNVGYYSLLLAKGNPDIKIIAIEAHPDNFIALNKNVKVNNFKNITSINKAVSNQSGGKLRLYEHRKGNGNKNTSRFDLSNRFDSNSFIEINSDSLDNLLKRTNKTIYVIKIDIEGEEVNALLGAENTLKNTRKIIVEIHSDENLKKVKQILLSHQFSIEEVKTDRHMRFVIGTREILG